MMVGFIGVGNMGGPMCRNIIKNTNHEVTVFDLSPEAEANLTAAALRNSTDRQLLKGLELLKKELR